MTKQLKSALALAAAGYRVFPAHGITADGNCTCGNANCSSKGKHPAVKNWQRAASKDEKTIKEMWAQNPIYNPAVATGAGLLVLDVDTYKGGRESLHQLETQYRKLPSTRAVVTGGGGYHYYFRSEKPFRNSVSKIAPGLDIRADGGYVIGPGATHKSGRQYEWEILCAPEDGQDAAPIPRWLEGLILGHKTNAEEKNPPALNERIPEGQRNETLYKLGCSLRGQHGYTMREVEAALKEANQKRCDPPLETAELDVIIRQVDQYRRAGGPEAVFTPSGIMRFTDVAYEPPRFLLPPYIPEGALTILQGNPGDGKTAFLCKLAAIVSSGKAFLETSCSQGNVLLLSVEDDPSTLRGRIAASGGDLGRCFFVQEAHTLDFLAPEIEEYVKQENIRLLAFDPLQAFLGRSLDMNKSNETRPVLAALAAMAKRNKCAVVLVSHLNKGAKDGPAIYRALGSIDIPGAARSVIHIGRSARDLEQRLAIHVKSSNARAGCSIAFHIGERGGVIIDGLSSAGYEDLATVGHKARTAAQGIPAEGVIAACKNVLAQYPNGKKLTYDELGITWPDGVKPKQLLDALRGRLEDEGISVTTGERTNQKGAVIVAPLAEYLL